MFVNYDDSGFPKKGFSSMKYKVCALLNLRKINNLTENRKTCMVISLIKKKIYKFLFSTNNYLRY